MSTPQTAATKCEHISLKLAHEHTLFHKWVNFNRTVESIDLFIWVQLLANLSDIIHLGLYHSSDNHLCSKYVIKMFGFASSLSAVSVLFLSPPLPLKENSAVLVLNSFSKPYCFSIQVTVMILFSAFLKTKGEINRDKRFV